MDEATRPNDDIWIEAQGFEKRRLGLLASLRAGEITGRQWWASQRLLVEGTSLEAQAMATRRWLLLTEPNRRAIAGDS